MAFSAANIKPPAKTHSSHVILVLILGMCINLLAVSREQGSTIPVEALCNMFPTNPQQVVDD